MTANNDIDYARRQLEQCRGKWPLVCHETGLDYSWLTKFAQGQIVDPGYSKVMTLAEYFRRGAT